MIARLDNDGQIEGFYMRTDQCCSRPSSPSAGMRETPTRVGPRCESSDAKAAKAFGITRGHLSRVLRGEKPMTAKIALVLGYEQQRWYMRYEQRD